MPGGPGPVDALSGLAPLLRVRPELESLCRFGAQWAAHHGRADAGWAPFHLIARGTCLLEAADCPAIRLAAGDVAVLPHGNPHIVRAVASGAAESGLLRTRHNGAITVKSNQDGVPETELVCGRLRFEHSREAVLLSALPPVIVVRAGVDAEAARFSQLLMTIRDELNAARPGAAAIAADLASALLVMALRVQFDQHPAGRGLLALLGRHQTARTVAAMLGEPDRAWTLDDLAARAGMARATLVRIFRQEAGMAPLAFLTELRLGLARRRLRDGAEPLAAIAAAVGYQSESTFSRAFRRRFGIRPGEARRTGRQDDGT